MDHLRCHQMKDAAQGLDLRGHEPGKWAGVGKWCGSGVAKMAASSPPFNLQCYRDKVACKGECHRWRQWCVLARQSKWPPAATV